MQIKKPFFSPPLGSQAAKAQRGGPPSLKVTPPKKAPRPGELRMLAGADGKTGGDTTKMAVFDLSDPTQFGKAAAMGCKVFNHSRGKMEKRAYGVGTVIGAGYGGAAAPKGGRLEGVARGGVRGAGWDIGGALGGAAGGIGGLGLGGIAGGGVGALLAAMNGMPPEEAQELIMSLAAGGAGLGGVTGLGGGYLGGGYLGQKAMGDMLGPPNYQKKQEQSLDNANHMAAAGAGV